MFRWILVITLFCFTSVFSYESVELELDTGTILSLKQFNGEGKTLFLILPSERGLGQGYIPLALDLAALDYDVWSVNLHETYMMPTGRNSLDEVELEDLSALLDVIQKQGFEETFLVSSSRGVPLALKAAYQWQQKNPESTLLHGLLSFSPHLIKGRTEMGDDASYVEISAFSNLPVYMFQAQYSTKYARSWEISEQLQEGGSQVFIHFLKGVQGGFHMRPVEDLTETDLEMRAQLPDLFENAVNLIRQLNIASLPEGYQLSETASAAKQASKIKIPSLHPYTGNKIPPQLSLYNLQDQLFDLNRSKGEVILVNFWASWCGPCVEEIPSLSRLVDRMKGRPFRVVAVNIGESKEGIKQFVKSIPVNFDILLDKDGHAVRDWKVYAYPSNYLIDQDGYIQYAYRGALEWDAPSIVETIEQLL